MDTVRSRVLQDSRKQSRISVQIECRFESEEVEYEALMLDLSQGGTFLSSTAISGNKDFPDQESKISITLATDHLKTPLTLKGTIKRSVSAMSEFGKVGQFGIEFDDPPLALLRLISVLSRAERNKTSARKK